MRGSAAQDCEPINHNGQQGSLGMELAISLTFVWNLGNALMQSFLEVRPASMELAPLESFTAVI
jgi:hypothetical protein